MSASTETMGYSGVTCPDCGCNIAADGSNVCCGEPHGIDGRTGLPRGGEAYCLGCCGPHVPFNPQVEFFPQG